MPKIGLASKGIAQERGDILPMPSGGREDVTNLYQKIGKLEERALEFYGEASINTPGRIGWILTDGTPLDLGVRGGHIPDDLALRWEAVNMRGSDHTEIGLAAWTEEEPAPADDIVTFMERGNLRVNVSIGPVPGQVNELSVEAMVPLTDEQIETLKRIVEENDVYFLIFELSRKLPPDPPYYNLRDTVEGISVPGIRAQDVGRFIRATEAEAVKAEVWESVEAAT